MSMIYCEKATLKFMRSSAAGGLKVTIIDPKTPDIQGKATRKEIYTDCSGAWSIVQEKCCGPMYCDLKDIGQAKKIPELLNCPIPKELDRAALIPVEEVLAGEE